MSNVSKHVCYVCLGLFGRNSDLKQCVPGGMPTDFCQPNMKSNVFKHLFCTCLGLLRQISDLKRDVFRVACPQGFFSRGAARPKGSLLVPP